jgi:hypothetical protein
MRKSQRLIAGPLAGFVLLLSACATVPEEETAGGGGAEVKTEGGVVQITLTEDAADRLGMESAPIRNAGKGAGKSNSVMPYAALLYGPTGEPFTYTNADALTFEHAPLEVERIDGNRVFLRDGPPPGTEVVTQGGAELWGAETGIDE